MVAKPYLSELRTAPWDQFRLRWRFTEPEHTVLPAYHLDQIQPLDPDSSRRLWSAVLELHHSDPFTTDFFSGIHETSLQGVHEDLQRAVAVRKWLYERGVPFQQDVLLCWQPDTAVRTVWKMVVKYFDAFWYPGSDDLTVVDKTFSWAVLFHHEETLYWGGQGPAR